ncbi:hypothetical protein FHS95_002591 [Sphingomonas naasensis]|uniref:Uncharacterized protein n=1 Tax=Sphingomonas naasensis TaxID=1344951 RepID=A0A4S1WN20_9SPHN|nr:DUF6445 family protein [Sphingomonas naasensis]NIJ20899.1 hypothetical protein [Sphingomonas naasensis]TGX43290.1 hypothetical protein E5A74_08995 [Sphingomonas naasensis]
MKPELRRVGTSQSPVVTVDGFSGDVQAVIDIAAALAPFSPDAKTHYPGVRRILSERDGDAWAYVRRTLKGVAPFLGGAFDFVHFDLLGASFSMVTARPETLSLPQRAPHFDSTDPDYIAILHYLGDTPGTAFYRQRSTGIEAITDANCDSFIAAARRESAALSGYINGSNDSFEAIGTVAGHADRLAIYQGRLLHSGLIAEDMNFSPDPRRGRLTANLFVKGYRS